MPELIDRLQAALGESYKIKSELGGGGMSRVFVAEEVELGRTVVVKVLPPDLAAGLNVDRFRREIQMAARLQHPHIVPVLSAGAKDGLLYYTMPFIQGESLRARLSRSGELPVAEAARILREVADALEYAHENGIVHRDIKPENVLLSRNHALVMDFGVAKALSEATGQTNLTSVGVALGTPTYMSPEQATADPMTDHRSDIYSLGVLGYELLAGRPPFTGNTPQQVLAAQVTEAPVPITKHRANIPPILSVVIMKSLEKKPADRYQGAGEVREQLEIVGTPTGGMTPHATAPVPAVKAARFSPMKAGVIGGIAVSLLLIALVASKYSSGSSAAYTTSAARQITNDDGIEITPALSPDGKFLAYAAGTQQKTEVFVRQLSGGQPIQLGLGRAPQWSPDGSRIVFVQDGAIVESPALGGSSRILVPGAGQGYRSPTYSHDGKYLAFSDQSTIEIANANGTDKKTIFGVQAAHSISWSPDGKRLAFVAGNTEFTYSQNQFANVSPSRLWIIDANGKNPIQVGDNIHIHLSPVWASDGAGLFFVSSEGGGRDLYYQKIGRNAVDGEPQRLTTGLSMHGISADAAGNLAYSALNTSVSIWSAPIPASGIANPASARQITSSNERIETVSASSDGQWLAFDSDRGGNFDIYKIRADGSGMEQVTRDAADDFRPFWSHDGTRISYHSWRSGNRDVYTIAVNGTDEKLAVGGPDHEWSNPWPPDGEHLLVGSDRDVPGKPKAARMYVAPLQGGALRLVADFQGIGAAMSPSGEQVALATSGVLRVLNLGDGSNRVILASEPDRQILMVGGWNSSGRIFFRFGDAEGAMHIGSVFPDGSNPTAVLRFDRTDWVSYRREFFATDKDFYFTIGKHQADIWLMRLNRN